MDERPRDAFRDALGELHDDPVIRVLVEELVSARLAEHRSRRAHAARLAAERRRDAR